MKKRSLSVVTLVAALALMLPTGSAWATHRSEAEQAIREARAAHEQAASVKAASPETARMIKQAEELLPSRQYTKAVEVANQARQQDTFAFEQASGGVTADPAASEAATQAIAAAEAARKKADSVGGEWRDTADLIKEADGLAKSGQYEEAVALANQAKRQGESGYEQAIREKDAGFPSYMVRKP